MLICVYKETKKKGSEDMGEKEKSVMERLVRVLPTLSDFDRGYILGKAEQTAVSFRINQG